MSDVAKVSSDAHNLVGDVDKVSGDADNLSSDANKVVGEAGEALAGLHKPCDLRRRGFHDADFVIAQAVEMTDELIRSVASVSQGRHRPQLRIWWALPTLQRLSAESECGITGEESDAKCS